MFNFRSTERKINKKKVVFSENDFLFANHLITKRLFTLHNRHSHPTQYTISFIVYIFLET